MIPMLPMIPILTTILLYYASCKATNDTDASYIPIHDQARIKKKVVEFIDDFLDKKRNGKT